MTNAERNDYVLNEIAQSHKRLLDLSIYRLLLGLMAASAFVLFFNTTLEPYIRFLCFITDLALFPVDSLITRTVRLETEAMLRRCSRALSKS
jgi:hypothetical protein